MIGSIFGCSICHNDNGVLNMSRLNRYLLEILRTFGDTHIYPALYCDAIYQLINTIINRYSNPNGREQVVNFSMAVQRIFIEHLFSDLKKRGDTFVSTVSYNYRWRRGLSTTDSLFMCFVAKLSHLHTFVTQ